MTFKNRLSDKVAQRWVSSQKTASPQKNHPIVYHGSSEDDIEELRGGRLTYKGGIGPGLYLTYYRRIAEFYGDHVYRGHLTFPLSDVFILDGRGHQVEHFPEMQGYSLLQGEGVTPFMFDLDGTRVLVAGRLEETFRQEIAKSHFAFLVEDEYFSGNDIFEYLLDFWEIEEGYRRVPVYDSLPTDVDDIYPEVNEFLRDNIADAFEEETGQEVDDFMNPPEGFIDFEIEYLRPIMDRIQELLDKAHDKVEGKYDLVIDLDEIGPLVERAGYKAVWFANMRINAPVGSELLLFDSSHVADVELIE